MVDVRIVNKSGFRVIGKKTYIKSQDNDQFAKFWGSCREKGVLNKLGQIREENGNMVTNGSYIGLPACFRPRDGGVPSNRKDRILVANNNVRTGKILREINIGCEDKGRYAS